jgi:hypothetical protein
MVAMKFGSPGSRRSPVTADGRDYQFEVDADSGHSVCRDRTAGLPCADLTIQTL